MKKLPKWSRVTFWIIGILVAAEIILRFGIGLGDLAVYREDNKYEYFYMPNQDVWRFGNRITTNEYGMRSKKVDKKKKITILEFGDSVLNGGSHIDQSKLVSTLDENYLNDKFDNKIQILNISAQSWGVSNAFAFLKKHGDFNASVIVLVFSSHDLNDNMHFKKVVGNHQAWPESKPLLALTDAWSRFIWPKIRYWATGKGEYDYLNDFNDKKINPGWQDFFDYGRAKKIPVVVYLHASQKETMNGRYDNRGKKIIALCKSNSIPVIIDLKQMSGSDSFIDEIHMNASGHKVMSDLIRPKLEEIIVKLAP